MKFTDRDIDRLVDRVVEFYHQGDAFSQAIEKWLYAH